MSEECRCMICVQVRDGCVMGAWYACRCVVGCVIGACRCMISACRCAIGECSWVTLKGCCPEEGCSDSCTAHSLDALLVLTMYNWTIHYSKIFYSMAACLRNHPSSIWVLEHGYIMIKTQGTSNLLLRKCRSVNKKFIIITTWKPSIYQTKPSSFFWKSSVFANDTRVLGRSGDSVLRWNTYTICHHPNSGHSSLRNNQLSPKVCKYDLMCPIVKLLSQILIAGG